MTKPTTAPPKDKPVVPRDELGRFPKGTSGNPLGRAKGTKNRITLARLMLEEQLRETLTKAGPKLIKKAIRMALNGDEKVLRVLLDKMLATPKGDDSEGAADRDVKVIIQNLTGPQPANPPIEGFAVRIPVKEAKT